MKHVCPPQSRPCIHNKWHCLVCCSRERDGLPPPIGGKKATARHDRELRRAAVTSPRTNANPRHNQGDVNG